MYHFIYFYVFLCIFSSQEYSVISYQCEPIDGLSYHFLPEERALQLFLRYKGDLAKVSKNENSVMYYNYS